MARKIIADNKEITNFKELAKVFDLYQPQNEHENESESESENKDKDEKTEPNPALEALAEVDKVKPTVGAPVS